jgi:hypothetical protein
MDDASVARIPSAPAEALSRASREGRWATFWFLACWAFLNALVNLRYPAAEPPFWYFLPSIDVTLLFGLYGLAGAWRWRLPAWVHATVAAALLFFRFLRFGDGIERQFFRTLDLYVDLRLLPNLARLFYVTVPPWRLAFELLLGVGTALALAVAAYAALRQAERYLGAARHRAAFAGVVTLFAVASLHPVFRRSTASSNFYAGAFGASIVPRLIEEGRRVFEVPGKEASELREIAATQERLKRLPSGLEKLGGAPVFLFVVESYGQALFSREDYRVRMGPEYDDWRARLESKRWNIVSDWLDSPTYGGRSWFAHATLATGVRVSDQLEYGILLDQNPSTMAGFFRSAGYETILLEPGTTSRFPEPATYGFERTYNAWDFDYRGPSFSWVPMPDQYVLDFLRRREIVHRSKPIFVECVLVSSHAPWNVQPPLVEVGEGAGVEGLENGAIYGRLSPVFFPITWTNLGDAGEAYLHAIRYDLTVLERFIEHSLPEGALVIVLGDHQPVAAVAGSASHAVPVHVMSQDGSLTARFEARGYTRGWRPQRDGAAPGMETFLPTLLDSLSSSLRP